MTSRAPEHEHEHARLQLLAAAERDHRRAGRAGRSRRRAPARGLGRASSGTLARLVGRSGARHARHSSRDRSRTVGELCETGAMQASRPRVAVVGHVEWVQFARVPHVPRGRRGGPRARRPSRSPPAAERWRPCSSARLAGGARLITVLGGDDELARRSIARLHELGVESIFNPSNYCHPQGGDARGWGWRAHDHHLRPASGGAGGSTGKPPWAESAQMDAVYFTAGDLAALRAARAARVLVASPRAGGGARARSRAGRRWC